MQAGATFVWQASVSTTPNPAFRRIEIIVAEPQTPDYALARLDGLPRQSGAAAMIAPVARAGSR